MFIASTYAPDKDRQLLLLGLSRANRDRLDAGQPIKLSTKTHGVAIPKHLDIILFVGETEAEMEASLAELIGPTTIRDQKRPQ